MSQLGKVLHFPGKIFKALRGEPITPTLLEVHPTQLCNQACPHCVGGETNKVQGHARLTLDEYRRSVHDPYLELGFAGEETDKRLSFSGETGDPLVCPDFFPMLAHTKLPFIIITNGYGKPDEIMLKAEGIRISLDAVDGDAYGRRHGIPGGAGALERVQRHVRQLVEWKERLRTDTSLGVGYLTDASTTYEELRAAIASAEELGVDYINFRPMHHDTTTLPARVALQHDSQRVQVLFSDKYDRLGDAAEAVSSVCHAIRFLMVIGADLSAYNCCHFTGRTEYAVGSLRNSTLRELVLESTRQAHRYPNASCVPLCRGHRINIDVARVAARGRFDTYL